jgi:hypothetical protein
MTNSLRYFEYDHLPEPMRSVSKEIHDTAVTMIQLLKDAGGPETEMGMRKLLEAKDCFVRASLDLRRPE